MFAFTQLLNIVSAFGFFNSPPVPEANEAILREPFDVHHGWATHYNPSAGTGACGWQNQDSDIVAAIGTELYQEMMVDGNPNHSKACGKKANVSWHGKTVKVKIVDRCQACRKYDLDLSPATFKEFAPLGKGKLEGISWEFN